MIRGEINSGWSTVFAAALTLAIVICCHAIFWHPSKKLSTTIRQYVLRIEGVPIDKSCESLQRDLEFIIDQDSVLKNNRTTLVQLFLIQRGQNAACTTATFQTSIPVNEITDKLRKVSASRFPYRFDSNFHGITPIYEASGGADIDVIAVPGLGSHAIGSWKSPSSNDVWLRDYLPGHIPNLRVLLYGYDTSLIGSDSKDSIEELGLRFLESIKAFRTDTTDHRLIVFIGHSLGGLLIKEALVFAHNKSNDPRNLSLYKACYGLLLFGVPNLGLRNEQLLSIVQGQPNQRLIQDLVVDDDSEPSPFLKRISNQFSECCKGQFQVISFFERNQSPSIEIQPDRSLTKTSPKILMVTEKSATSTGLTAAADESNFPLRTDHSGLVKYESKSQEDYLIVKEKLKLLIIKAKQESRRRITENTLTPEQERSWNDLNQPPYTSFRNSSKLAKPEQGTLKWLVKEEAVDLDEELESQSSSEQRLRGKDFISWRDSDKSESLLISAAPGRGKSVLSNFVVGHLEHKISSQEPSYSNKIIYYFCNITNDEASRNANSILQALIVQLCERQQNLFRILPPEYEKNSRSFFSTSFETLLDIFDRMLREDTYSQVYCIIDGLDVYQEGMDEMIKRLFEQLSTGIKVKSPVFKLLCTTRPDKPRLDLWTRSIHKILRCSSHDLDIFIKTRVDSLGKNFTDDMRTTIKKQLREKADSTFLWLDVVIKRIRSIDIPTLRTIRETIRYSPQDFSDLYHLLVQQLVQKDRNNARFLALVVYARRPLRLEALADAMALNPAETYTSYKQCEEDRPQLRSDELHKSFGTLLDIAEGRVYLIHQSVKNYFNDRNPLYGFTSIDPPLLLAHASMA